LCDSRRTQRKFIPLKVAGFQVTLRGGFWVTPDTVWAAVLDEKFVIEVQRRNQEAFLCLFGLDGKCLHVEPTNLSFGAVFGPDVSDVADWQSRAQQVVDSWPEP